MESRFDNNVPVNERSWAVTLLWTGKDHVQIIIEGEGACTYDMTRGSPAAKDNYNDDESCCARWFPFFSKKQLEPLEKRENGLSNRYWREFEGNHWTMSVKLDGVEGEQASISIDNLTEKKIAGYKNKSETFSVDRQHVLQMLGFIDFDIEQPPLYRLAQNINLDLNKRQSAHNSTTWARERIGIVDKSLAKDPLFGKISRSGEWVNLDQETSYSSVPLYRW